MKIWGARDGETDCNLVKLPVDKRERVLYHYFVI